MTFASTGRLKQHVKHAHRKEEVFSCPTCNEQGLCGKENLKLHMYKSHGVGEIFRCEDCNFETSARGTFVKHTATAHPIDADEHHTETTEASASGFGNTSDQHIVLTDDEGVKSHTGTAMGISSPSRGKLASIGLLRFKCSFCTRAFKSKAGLKLHLQQHTNEAMHNCMICPFKTPQQQNLIKHLATKHKKDLHGEELKSNKECKLCDFKCVAEYQLKAHSLRKHTARSDMKYQCNECGYASVEKSALDKHIRFRHTKVIIRRNV